MIITCDLIYDDLLFSVSLHALGTSISASYSVCLFTCIPSKLITSKAMVQLPGADT